MCVYSQQPTEIKRKLTCSYFNGGNNPRLIIQPVKVEVIYLDLRIYILRRIVSDREIDRLKKLGGPMVSGCKGCVELVNVGICRCI